MVKFSFLFIVMMAVAGGPAVVEVSATRHRRQLRGDRPPTQDPVLACARDCSKKCLIPNTPIGVVQKEAAKCAANFVAKESVCKIPSKGKTKGDTSKQTCLANLACVGGTRCSDGSCAPSGSCCPGMHHCSDGTTCIAVGSCCALSDLSTPCNDGSCVASGTCCPGMHHCSDGATCVADRTCCAPSDRPVPCDDGTCVGADACCKTETTCEDGTCAVPGTCCQEMLLCSDQSTCVRAGDCCPDENVNCCGNNVCEAGETTLSCAQDCSFQCTDGTCDSAHGESVENCRFDCFEGPAICGDTFCDMRLGETGDNCPADCFQVPAFLEVAEAAGLPRVELQSFPEETILQILLDSPDGFASGTPQVFSDHPLDGSPLTFEAEADGSLWLRGKFIPDGSMLVPAGTKVRAYSPSIVRTPVMAEGPVAEDGSYEIHLTDIGSGVTPFLLVFTPPPSRRRNLIGQDHGHHQQRALAVGASVPTMIWCLNNNACPSPVTFKLTWEGTSDVDLYVIEPTGRTVWYGAKDGDVGFLDLDDTDGFGPEHYYYNALAPPREGSVFKALANMYDLTDPPGVLFTLQAYRDGKEIDVRTGVLQDNGDNSSTINVVIKNDPASGICSSCSAGTDSSSRILAPLLLTNDYSQPPPQCQTCAPKNKWGHCWCPGMFFWKCDDVRDNWSEQYKLYMDLLNFEATKPNVVAYAYLLLGTLAKDGVEGTSDFDKAMTSLKDSQNGDWVCAKYQILDAYCLYVFGKEALDYVGLVASLKSLGNVIPELAAKNARGAALEYIKSKAKSETKWTNVDSVINFAMAVNGIPNVLKKFANAVAGPTSTCGFSW